MLSHMNQIQELSRRIITKQFNVMQPYVAKYPSWSHILSGLPAICNMPTWNQSLIQ
jgi:hypothetical protein